jgi:hypothetical protein
MQTIRVGGERERVSLAVLAFLVPPQRAVTAYLEPNRNSLQEPVGGRSETTGGGVPIDAETRQTDVENVYLEPIRGSLQKPIGGLSLLTLEPAKTMLPPLNKGAIEKNHTSTPTATAKPQPQTNQR